MEKDLTDQPSTSALVKAMEDNHCALFSLFARLPGAEVYDGSDVLRIITNEPSAVFNTVHRARFAPAEADAAIEATIAEARSRGVRLLWFVDPSTRPADLADSLQAHGFVHDEDIFAMAMDLSGLPDDRPLPPGVEITEAIDEQDLETWCSTMVAAFALPETVGKAYLRWLLALSPEERSSVHLYLGWLDHVAVATHLLILGGGAAGIHFLGTLPAARGRGVGGALRLNTLREGRAKGYRIGVTEAEPMAVGTCHRLGFKDYHTVSTYIWRGDDVEGTTGRRSRRMTIASALRRVRRR